MSGTNRLINNMNTLKGNSIEALKQKQLNSNAQAIMDTKEGISLKMKSEMERKGMTSSRLTVKKPR